MLADAGCSRGQLGSVVSGCTVRSARASRGRPDERLAVPVRIENDANLGTLGEACYGRPRPRQPRLPQARLQRGRGPPRRRPAASRRLRVRRGARACAGGADGDVCRRCGGRGCLAANVGSSLLDFAQRYGEGLALPQVLALVAEREPGVRRLSPTSAGSSASRWPASARCSTRRRWSSTGRSARPASTCWRASGSPSTGTRAPGGGRLHPGHRANRRLGGTAGRRRPWPAKLRLGRRPRGAGAPVSALRGWRTGRGRLVLLTGPG